jgi:hypothetical protein
MPKALKFKGDDITSKEKKIKKKRRREEAVVATMTPEQEVAAKPCNIPNLSQGQSVTTSKI